jgi:coenzyme PQQ precursor peptide PqqA
LVRSCSNLKEFRKSGVTAPRHSYIDGFLAHATKETIMAWTTPTLVEICVGLEINGYLPAEF